MSTEKKRTLLPVYDLPRTVHIKFVIVVHNLQRFTFRSFTKITASSAKNKCEIGNPPSDTLMPWRPPISYLRRNKAERPSTQIKNKKGDIVSPFFIGYGLELSRLFPLIIFHIKRKYLCKSEADVKAAWLPRDLGYGTRVPGDTLIITIVLCYSVIAPLILPFGVLYFGLGWLVLRNQALKVNIPSYESYGRMWPHIQIRLIASLILYQVTMSGYFGVKKFYHAPFLIPLPIMSLVFSFVRSKKFYRFFQHTAVEVAAHELKEIPYMEQVYRAFIPPSLSSGKIYDEAP